MRLDKKLIFGIGVFLVLLLAASASTATTAQSNPAPIRDDANGFLCYDFRAWGQCFAYTATAKPVTELAPPPVPDWTPTARATAVPPTAVPATAVPATSSPSLTPVPPTAVPPTATKAAGYLQPELLNGGFEQDGGWVNYFLQTSSPGKEPNVLRASKGTGPFANMVYEGERSLHIRGEFMCFQGGAYQRLPVQTGQPLHLSAWVQTWSNTSDLFELASDPNTWQVVKVGIDPKGGTDPLSSRIEWSERPSSDYWQNLVVDTYAGAPFVSVWLFANVGYKYPNECNWAVKNNWALFDAVTLVSR